VTIHSYVGSKTTIKGNLECSKNFLVEGAVEGSLNSDGTIVLGKDAVVRGEVRAREVAVSGIVTIQAPVLKMEPGAQINGRIVMSRSSEEVELTAQIPEDSSSSAVKPHG